MIKQLTLQGATYASSQPEVPDEILCMIFCWTFDSFPIVAQSEAFWHLKAFIFFTLKETNAAKLSEPVTISMKYCIVCFSSGPDLDHQLCHFLLSSHNRWHKPIGPVYLERSADERDGVEEWRTKFMDKTWNHFEDENEIQKQIVCMKSMCVRTAPTSNTNSVESSGLCVIPLSATLSITAERRAFHFTDD